MLGPGSCTAACPRLAGRQRPRSRRARRHGPGSVVLIALARRRQRSHRRAMPQPTPVPVSTPTPPPGPSLAPRRAGPALYMLAAAALFALMDTGLKILSPHYPALQVAALRGAAALPLVLAWSLATIGARGLLRVH